MTTVQNVNYDASTQRRGASNKDKVVTATGGAALATMGKSGLRTAAAGKSVVNTMNTVKETTMMINKNVGVFEKLANSFRLDYAKFSADLTAKLAKLGAYKHFAAFAKSPIAKTGVSVFSGALAFFVLVTGVKNAAKNGSLAVDDLKSKYDKLCA